MIRVIYIWRISKEDFNDFCEVWRLTTRKIHETTPGARGSFCLQSIEAECEVITVALWEGEAQWREFIKNAQSSDMRALHDIGELISATPYNQIDDRTI